MTYFNCSRRGALRGIDLRSLLISSPALIPETLLIDAAEFLNRGGHDYAAVSNRGKVLGICSRTRFAELLGSRFGFALHNRSRVIDFLEPSYLEVRVDEPLVSILSKTFAREEKAFGQDVIVSDGKGDYLGLLPTQVLVKLQNLLLEEKVTHLEERRSELEEAKLRLERANEELQIAKDESLKAAKAKSDFLAVMSHEIRTPLNGVLGMMTLLSDSELDSDQAELLRVANDSAEALLLILNDILDFSRIEAGKVEIQKERFDIRELAESVLTLMAESAQESGLEVICDIDPDVPVMIEADSCRLRQILANLLGNAVKFTESGYIALKLSRVSNPVFGEADSLRMEVTDSGIGIAKEAQERLFQPFAQADSSTTRRFGGTGLGLAISAQLVRAMGGEIGLDSDAGKGTTFWLSLPLEIDEPIGNRYSPARFEPRKVALLNVSNRMVEAVIAREFSVRNIEALVCRDLLALDESRSRELWDRCDFVLADSHVWRGLPPERTGTKPSIVLYPSHGEKIEGAVGYQTHLYKPVRPSQLDRCIGFALSPEIAQALCSRAKERKRETSDLPRGLGRGEILVVDDNAINRRLVSRFVTKLGFETCLAEDGVEALEIATRARFEAILLDCRMPRMDGYEFAQKYRQWEQSNGRKLSTPIIALTANALQGDRQQCLDAGMQGYLTKPLKREALELELDRVLMLEPDLLDSLAPQGSEVEVVEGSN